MNRILLIAAALSALITGAHIFGGGPQYHAPILASEISQEDKAVYSILWHFVSFTLGANTLALIWSARQRGESAIAILVSVQTLIFAGLFLFYGQLRLGSIFMLPQWTLFLLIAGFSFWGASVERSAQ